MKKTILLIFMVLSSSIALAADEAIVINPIEVPKGKEELALKIWDKYATYFRKQPGYLGTKLHKSGDPKAKFRYINIAKWKSASDFIKALNNPEIKKIGEGFPKDMPHYPSIYEVIREE